MKKEHMKKDCVYFVPAAAAAISFAKEIEAHLYYTHTYVHVYIRVLLQGVLERTIFLSPAAAAAAAAGSSFYSWTNTFS